MVSSVFVVLVFVVVFVFLVRLVVLLLVLGFIFGVLVAFLGFVVISAIAWLIALTHPFVFHTVTV